MSDLEAAADLAVARAAIAAALYVEFAADDPEGEIRGRALAAVTPIVAAEQERQAAKLNRLRARVAELEGEQPCPNCLDTNPHHCPTCVAAGRG